MDSKEGDKFYSQNCSTGGNSKVVLTLNLELGLNFLANHCGICDSVSHFQFATQSDFKMRLEMKLIWCSVSF